jgi:hypothetical protein
LLSLFINLFDLILNSSILYLPYVSFLLPHLSLFVYFLFVFRFSFTLILLLFSKSLIYLFLPVLFLLKFLFVFLAQFDISLAFIPNNHIILFLHLIIHSLEHSICHSVHKFLGSPFPGLKLIFSVLFLLIKHSGISFLCSNIFKFLSFLLFFC